MFIFAVFSCNTNNRSPEPIKIGVAGGDGYVNSVLRPYVDQFSTRSHDWQNYVIFYVIPIGKSRDWQNYIVYLRHIRTV